MPGNKIHILCTSAMEPVPDGLVDQNHVIVDIIPFIKTVVSNGAGLKTTVLSCTDQRESVAFTSASAVQAVGDLLGGRKADWKIFCLEGTTSSLVASSFGSDAIAGLGRDARTLAEEIVSGETREIIFFCGNRRREELPVLLSLAGIRVREIKVYDTKLIPREVGKKYDGICFFSPSAVSSFFSANSIAGETVLFAIGPTTADSIRRYCGNRIITGERPGKEILLRQSIDYFLSPGKGNK